MIYQTFRHCRTFAIGLVISGIGWGQFAFADQQIEVPGYSLTVSLPDGWKTHPDIADPIIFAAVEQGTGTSLGIIATKVPDPKFVLNRKDADEGFMTAIGANGTILHRGDTKLLGQPAYFILAEVNVQGHKASVARIIMESPKDGYEYVVQYSVLQGAPIDDNLVKDVANRVKFKDNKSPP